MNQWNDIARTVGVAAQEISNRFIAAHGDLGETLNDLSRAQNDLKAAYEKRFSGTQYFSTSGGGTTVPSDWVRVARTTTERLRSAPVPWTDKGRRQLQQEFTQKVTSLMNTYDNTVREYALGGYRQMIEGGTGNAHPVRDHYTRTTRDAELPRPPIGPYAGPIDPANPPEVGPGPLNIYIGRATADQVSFSSNSYGNYTSQSHAIDLPGLSVPIVLDLDVAGAFVVDDRRCLEGPILNLLTALPANQLLIRFFDPEHGGNSAKFLFGLGDSADRVIGERVKTSDRELTELLQSTEEHITFVTQRFLQGEHKSLTEYNRAAGEVAEPYRLLVLYDFPSGFVRGGHRDEDQLSRLVKIIRNGPRSGVFTILVSDAVDAVTEQLPRFSAGERLNDTTIAAMSDWPSGVALPRATSAPRGKGTTAQVGAGAVSWRFASAEPPSTALVSSQLDAVKRNLHSAEDVKVTPHRVAELADQEQRSTSATLGESLRSTVADPDRPETWWRASSSRAIAAHFGRIGARQVADLIVDSEDDYGALIGGRPGSGKSVLIHAVIMSLAMEYSPDELELHLIDFKEGVEFQQYADIGLPHARVIAIESERDFGLSVLQEASRAIKTRGDLFGAAGNGIAKLHDYRERTGQPLKRIVLIIDEFQQLFYRDDKIASAASDELEQILRKGRAFGVHVLLASQSLAGMATLGKHVLGLIPDRIAMQSNDSDSRLILGEENPDAQTLVRAGEGILNRRFGMRDANKRFQAAFWDADLRESVLKQLVHRADSHRVQYITTVFAGHEPARIEKLTAASLAPAETKANSVGLPIGLPLTLDPDPTFAWLQREAGSNLLVVDEAGDGMLAVALAGLRQQGVAVDLLDFVGADEAWGAVASSFDALEDFAVHRHRSDLRRVLGDFTTLVDERLAFDDGNLPTRVLAIAGMGRARDFDPGDYDDDSPLKLLGKILRDGPEVGVHVIAWFDRPAGLDKRLDRGEQREFGLRLVGRLSANDASSLTDTETAAALKDGQGLLADIDRTVEVKVRKFARPSPGWITQQLGGS
ncbi:FtsK/SpoIIIE domain-containing protein [Mycolicibacterium arenosum]|uniref:FtsK/SpoIIIE domain-containing protein n=1 Tax=Mycolicibacterium arenosum TaxID=2952157 RepID=A0ABT1M443_9MYCO|nr:FtsK/SpoIIIE domain-containing protein [Mycolicibacterium sp. CAU 1645]MCP9273939.1 FtsK/SpoIIIE domain-containing protein [Mycolicibacterium sp. CAU 1645]